MDKRDLELDLKYTRDLLAAAQASVDELAATASHWRAEAGRAVEAQQAAERERAREAEAAAALRGRLVEAAQRELSTAQERDSFRLSAWSKDQTIAALTARVTELEACKPVSTSTDDALREHVAELRRLLERPFTPEREVLEMALDTIRDVADLEARVADLEGDDSTTAEHDLGDAIADWVAKGDEVADVAALLAKCEDYGELPGEPAEGEPAETTAERRRLDRLRRALDPDAEDEVEALRARVAELERCADAEVVRLLGAYRDAVVLVRGDLRPALESDGTKPARLRAAIGRALEELDELVARPDAVAAALRDRDAERAEALARVAELVAADANPEDEETETGRTKVRERLIVALGASDYEELCDELARLVDDRLQSGCRWSGAPDAPTANDPGTARPDRTDHEVVEQTNALARVLLGLVGYEVPEGYRFDQDLGRPGRGRSVLAWQLARAAQIELTDTDPDEALQNVAEGPDCADPKGRAMMARQLREIVDASDGRMRAALDGVEVAARALRRIAELVGAPDDATSPDAVVEAVGKYTSAAETALFDGGPHHARALRRIAGLLLRPDVTEPDKVVELVRDRCTAHLSPRPAAPDDRADLAANFSGAVYGLAEIARRLDRDDLRSLVQPSQWHAGDGPGAAAMRAIVVAVETRLDAADAARQVVPAPAPIQGAGEVEEVVDRLEHRGVSLCILKRPKRLVAFRVVHPVEESGGGPVLVYLSPEPTTRRAAEVAGRRWIDRWLDGPHAGRRPPVPGQPDAPAPG